MKKFFRRRLEAMVMSELFVSILAIGVFSMASASHSWATQVLMLITGAALVAWALVVYLFKSLADIVVDAVMLFIQSMLRYNLGPRSPLPQHAPKQRTETNIDFFIPVLVAILALTGLHGIVEATKFTVLHWSEIFWTVYSAFIVAFVATGGKNPLRVPRIKTRSV